MSADDAIPTSAWIDAALERHEAALLRYARRILGDADRAHDVVQDTFLKLTSRSPAELDGHLREWLFKVCRNRALDVRRKEQRMSVTAEATLPELPGRESEPSLDVERRELAGRLLGWLVDLPEPQQEVVRLRFQEGFAYRQIAEITGHTVSNVGFLLHKAITTLRERTRYAEARAELPIRPAAR